MRIKNQELDNISQPTTHNPQLIWGFTLIEVLVTATIIALLSTIGISGFQAVTRSGRDALRKADLESIRSALEIYKSEEGYYPDDNNSCSAESILVPDYINSYPPDPKSPTYQYCYNQTSNLTYTLCAHLENGSGDYDTECGGDNVCGDDYDCNYKVTNP